MRIIFLNTWNGKMEEGIKDFVAQQVGVTDVFCFQEVYDQVRPMLESILLGFKSIYASKGMGGNYDFSHATYVKKNLEIRSSQALLEDIPGVGLGLYIEIKGREGSIHVCNFHGVAYPVDEKLDDAGRLEQSRAVISFFHPLQGKKIIGGDFNMLPHAESIRTFSDNGHVDLIKKFHIQTTRNHLAWERYPGHEMYHSDYVFVSPDVNIKNFAVPNNEISDHLPLILDIEE